MAIAFDASSEGNYAAGSFTWTHTPVGTPKGVFVGVVLFGDNTDNITSVTYGGTTMTRSNTVVSGTTFRTWGYFLGASIPTGAQSVVVNLTGAPGGNMWGSAVSVTAGAGKNTQLAGTGSGTSTANPPTTTITGISGASYGFGVDGSNTTSESATAGTGFTMRQSFDEGSRCGYVESSTSENASGNLTVAFASTGTANAMVGIAVEEVAGLSIKHLTLLGVGT